MKHSNTLKFSTATALAALVMAGLPVANAQETDEATEAKTLDTVVVTGIRASLQQARDLKRNSNTVGDSIVAEDIAKFPDLNLAESLQRLPGVTINREAGEGRRVSLRGLGSNFTRVELNGMEVLGNTDSPQDSRGQASRDRAFDFNIFASDLFTRVDVTKSYSAEQTEGGIAGTVGLYTAKPFDYSGFEAAASFKGGTNTATEDFQPRIAGLISNNWGDFGALFSVAYSSRDTEEQGYNTYRWRPRTSRGSDISNLPQAQQDAIEGNMYRFPRGNRLSVWASEQERLGITSALQWAPSDNAELTLDVLYGEFTGDRDELHLASRGSSSTWLGGGTTVDGVDYPNSVINEIRVNSDNEVVYLDVSGANIATETRRQEAENTFEQIVLSGEWDVSEKLSVKGLIGYEESDYALPISDKFYLEQHNDVTSIYNGLDAYNVYGFDTTDASLWRAHEIDFEEVFQSTSFENAKLDLAYNLNDSFVVKGGLSYQKFENDQRRARFNNLFRSGFQSGEIEDDITSFAQVFSDHDDQAWTIVDFNGALNTLQQDPGVVAFIADYNAQNGTNWTTIRDPSVFRDSRFNVGVKEETIAAYLQLDWDRELGGMPFRGNVGVRYYDTETTPMDNEAGLSSTGSYDGILPAINASLEVKDGMIVRAAYSENINRLPLGTLSPIRYSVNVEAGDVTVGQSSDPSLEPYLSDNYDLSFEYYFDEVGMITAGLFHKNIVNFPGSQTVADVPFGSTGASLADLASQIPADSTLVASNDTNVDQFSFPISEGELELTGLELAFTTDFFFLPGAFSNFGFTGNYTYLDADEVAGLSESSFNGTLYYEKDTWGGRVSANYRSDYAQRFGAVADDEVGRGQEETLYVDFAAFYELNDKIKFTFDAVNLTDEEEQQVSDLEARRLYNVTQAGTTYFAGVNVKF